MSDKLHLVPRPDKPESVSQEEWENNLSAPARYSGAGPDGSREQEGPVVDGELTHRYREILVQTGDMEWVDKTLEGLSQKMLWRNDETGASITLVRFLKGSGIPSRHAHDSNQFMFCLSGRYSYLPTDVTLTPGSFYWNPRGSMHGPTYAHEDTVLLEVYDGPHYATQPDWYTDPEDAR